MDFIFRKAGLDDIDFLIDTIIEAEKSGTETLSYSKIFNVTESEARDFLRNALEEEVDGCELSISSFLLAETNGEIAGAISVWLEGSEGLPSTVLKGNILSFIIPKDSLIHAFSLSKTLSELHIDNESGTLQLGLVYVSENFRGQKLAKKMIEEILHRYHEQGSAVEKIQVQVFGNNISAIKAYAKVGFQPVFTKESSNSIILNYLPSTEKILMERKL